MSSAEPTIFLSYAHRDQPQARRVAKALERSGYTIWWDALIEGGSRYAATIDEALQKADAVVVLWSRHSIESDWVRDEAAQGRDRHRLVPLTLDGTQPPLGFRQLQVIDLSHWRGRADSVQMEAVRRAVSIALGQDPPPPRAVHETLLTRRQAVAAGAAAAVVGGGLIAWQSGLLAPGEAEARSIAVLPFKNLSGDPRQSYLSEGLTEEIRSALSRNLGLLVLAATSSNAVRDQPGDARSVARKLGVAHLLDGSVQRSGDRVRVAMNLADGRTGFSTWSESVDRKLGDIFAFQSEIARSIAQALSVRLATDAPVAGGTRNVRAYEAYLRGKALYNLAKDEASDRAARANFELAIGADPRFALAHAALSRAIASIASTHAEARELKPLYAAAVGHAEHAIALAPTRAEGHLALAYARFAGFLDVRGARAAYDAAYRYGRGDADIVLLYAIYAVRTRRFAEARDAIERALALDPLNPRTWRAAGSIAFASGRAQEAISRFDKALALNPAMSNAHALKGYALIRLGRLPEARAALDQENSAMFRLTGLAIYAHKAKDAALAEASFRDLVAQEGDAALYQQAQVLAQWGRSNDALDRLERARAVGDSGLVALATDPFLAPLANEPRYRGLVHSLGFA
ncbi:TIR domain-containing protein [Sphingomonas lutea]|uniref:TIR domain-containing protein n=1 Tax=Sphingomonas lutea TaxID=1045317 RepID=A0A7G9SGD7_9SPHN|nr:TIR domain-containing protein [Sphingomonas lutea]QNN66912.1 TIR domain-containing protein [Sphingomonas lutea]